MFKDGLSESSDGEEGQGGHCLLLMQYILGKIVKDFGVQKKIFFDLLNC